jgi:hypothetical protein
MPALVRAEVDDAIASARAHFRSTGTSGSGSAVRDRFNALVADMRAQARRSGVSASRRARLERDADIIEHLQRNYLRAWSGTSRGARNTVMDLIVRPMSAADEAAYRSIGSDLHLRHAGSYGGWTAGDAAAVRTWLVHQYATTQAVLAERGITSRRVWRGVGGDQARDIRADRARQGYADVAVRSVSSWTEKRSVAASFGSGGELLEFDAHASRFFAVWWCETLDMNFGASESEWIMAAPSQRVRIR